MTPNDQTNADIAISVTYKFPLNLSRKTGSIPDTASRLDLGYGVGRLDKTVKQKIHTPRREARKWRKYTQFVEDLPTDEYALIKRFDKRLEKLEKAGKQTPITPFSIKIGNGNTIRYKSYTERIPGQKVSSSLLFSPRFGHGYIGKPGLELVNRKFPNISRKKLEYWQGVDKDRIVGLVDLSTYSIRVGYDKENKPVLGPLGGPISTPNSTVVLPHSVTVVPIHFSRLPSDIASLTTEDVGFCGGTSASVERAKWNLFQNRLVHMYPGSICTHHPMGGLVLFILFRSSKEDREEYKVSNIAAVKPKLIKEAIRTTLRREHRHLITDDSFAYRKNIRLLPFSYNLMKYFANHAHKLRPYAKRKVVFNKETKETEITLRVVSLYEAGKKFLNKLDKNKDDYRRRRLLTFINEFAPSSPLRGIVEKAGKAALKIIFHLANFTPKDGSREWTKRVHQAKLSKELGVGSKTVHLVLKKLKQIKFMVAENIPGELKTFINAMGFEYKMRVPGEYRMDGEMVRGTAEGCFEFKDRESLFTFHGEGDLERAIFSHSFGEMRYSSAPMLLGFDGLVDPALRKAPAQQEPRIKPGTVLNDRGVIAGVGDF